MAKRPNQVITSTTPPSVDTYTKTIQVARTDTTAFEAFVLPKYAVISGAYVVGTTASNATTTAIVDVGTNPGTADEIIDSFNLITNGKGYQPAGAATGSLIGTQLTADTLFKAKYSETGTASSTGGPWLVKVEYYIPQQGFSW